MYWLSSLLLTLLLTFLFDSGPCKLLKNESQHHISGCLIGILSDFADEYPSAEVIGTDLSPIQPAFVPPNLRFEIDDASEDWTFPEDHFDLIHIRALYGAISDWPKLYSQALKYGFN